MHDSARRTALCAPMNISQQEYESKYAEYLRRLNRRHSLSEPVDDGWTERRRLFSFPGTDHTLNHRKLRRKRSLNNDFDLVYIRFDIPTRNATTGEMTGFRSPSLYHDPSVPGALDTGGEEDTDTAAAAAAASFVALTVQEIPPNGSRWYQLPLEEAVRTWLDGSRKNLGLELYCEGCHAHGIHIVHDSSPYFRSYDETPVLNVVGRLVQREKRSRQRYRPQIPDYQSPPKTTACTAGNKKCCRHPLLVNFRDIEGFDFIIQPKIFDAGFCRGRCPTKYHPANHHALLQSLLHEHIKYDVPKPCCAPSSLDHIDVLHADPKNPQRLKVSTWHNMRVLECACS
uniref:TGF-beta family profile domain-containing protein n=1 Tax=Anopheles farauti TaxID=69004 RepID=A0A182QGR5_9DIPT